MVGIGAAAIGDRGSARWWWPAAAGLAILVATACGPAGHEVAVATGSTALPTTTTAAWSPPTDAVPFRDLPAAPEPPPPAPPPVTAPPATSPPCRANQLSITMDGHNGATGMLFTYFKLANTTAATCSLGGFPKVVGLVAGRAPVTATNLNLPEPDPGPADLPPGASAEVAIGTTSNCEPTAPPPPADEQVRLTVPGGGDLSLPVGFDPVCGIGASTFYLPTPPLEMPRPRANLSVSVSAPPAVNAGTALTYAVTIHNSGGTDFVLNPCPNYVQSLGPYGKDLHGLNCDAARPVPAHGGETFLMELDIPADAPSGDTALLWGLAAPGSPPPATMPVHVQADPSRPAVTTPPGVPPCATTTGPPPCGPGMTVGVAYPYALPTHCGIGTIILDGLRWTPQTAPPAATPAPFGWTTPYENGTFTVTKPSVGAEFRGQQGLLLEFDGPSMGRPPPPPVTCAVTGG